MKKFQLNETDKQPITFTEEQLKNSDEFKKLVTGKVSAIKQLPGVVTPSYLVIHQFMDKYTISRFWKSPNKKTELDKIRYSNDAVDLYADELISHLLEHYES